MAHVRLRAVDFFFADKLLRPGGVVGFNDCGWRAVHRVMNFVRTHRRYEELDVGLSPSFRGQNVIVTALRRLEGRSGADRYFRKQENWEPNWNFYRRF